MFGCVYARNGSDRVSQNHCQQLSGTKQQTYSANIYISVHVVEHATYTHTHVHNYTHIHKSRKYC